MRHLPEDAQTPIGGQPPISNLPAAWTQTSLDNILSLAQLRQLEALLKANPDPEDALAAMKKYFSSISADLAAKDVHHGYLAYALYAQLTGVI